MDVSNAIWLAILLGVSAWLVTLVTTPLVILFSIIFWAWLWGPWGMVMAVPIIASGKIVFENIPSLRPLPILMSGKPRPAQTEPSVGEAYEGSPVGPPSAPSMMADASE